jgi:hypothetical protein
MRHPGLTTVVVPWAVFCCLLYAAQPNRAARAQQQLLAAVAAGGGVRRSRVRAAAAADAQAAVAGAVTASTTVTEGLLELNKDTFQDFLDAAGEKLVVVDFFTGRSVGAAAAAAAAVAAVALPAASAAVPAVASVRLTMPVPEQVPSSSNAVRAFSLVLAVCSASCVPASLALRLLTGHGCISDNVVGGVAGVPPSPPPTPSTAAVCDSLQRIALQTGAAPAS